MRHYAVLVIVFAISISLLPAQPSSGGLNIQVEDVSGAPIPGASVLVQHWAGPGKLIQDGAATTDAQGHAIFKLEPTATYHVFVSARAFVPAAASVGSFGETGHIFKLAVGQGGGVTVESPPK